MLFRHRSSSALFLRGSEQREPGQSDDWRIQLILKHIIRNMGQVRIGEIA
jgi:hypothetical protein